MNARSISYIEAHGTGTELGDPIEITGLTQAFAQDTGEKQFCAIGSAKSNIGHLEAAAGIAGVCKVVLQLRDLAYGVSWFRACMPKSSIHTSILPTVRLWFQRQLEGVASPGGGG